MAYTPSTWANGSAGGTPLSAARLNAMDSGIDQAHDLYDLGVGATGNASVTTSETTTSTAYTDLATVGPTLTLVVPASGKVLVHVGALLVNSTAASQNFMGVALSGANTASPSDNQCFRVMTALANTGVQGSSTYLLTGLTPGSTTFTAKYRVSANTMTASARTIVVQPI